VLELFGHGASAEQTLGVGDGQGECAVAFGTMEHEGMGDAPLLEFVEQVLLGLGLSYDLVEGHGVLVFL
jgi:hypothetical protein